MSNKKPYLPYQVIKKKRDGHPLDPDEIKWFINSLLDGSVENYQMTALLMAIYFRGMNFDETAALTDAMLYSGKVLNFNDPLTVDKHSTGGIGDKASFILAPIAAACGVKVPMIAGRGLGHTGGTIDKVEAIKGFNTQLDLEKFQELLIANGLVLIGQTEEIAPADKIIYGLRDVTATIDSVPIITASIMSKKLAEGANSLVMDIKTGNGAFMSKLEDAKALALSLEQTAIRFNRNIMTVITDMSQPLGNCVGNSIEIIESIETLKGNGPSDLTELSLLLAGGMIHLAGLAKDEKHGKELATCALENGLALKKFKELINAQGGDGNVVDNPELLPMAECTREVRAPIKGQIHSMKCSEIGLMCTELGGGRKIASDPVDPAVGFKFHKKIGDAFNADESLLTIYHHPDQSELAREIEEKFINNIFDIKPSPVNSVPEFIGEIRITKA